MKHVFMILILLGAFAVNDAIAQPNCNPANCKPADCPPCPPGCCIFNCCSPNGAVALSSDQPVEVAFAALMADGVKPKYCKMSRKEIKACIASCKAQTGPVQTAGCQPTPSCTSKDAKSAHTTVSANSGHLVTLQKS